MTAMFESWELEELSQAQVAAITSQQAAENTGSWWAGYFAGCAVGAAQGRLGVSRLVAEAPRQLGQFSANLAATLPPVRGFDSVQKAMMTEEKAA